MDIKLNLINRSNDANNSQIVIFQRNPAAGADDRPVAWRVFGPLGRGDAYPFDYPLSTGISSRDPWGNYTPMMPVENGQLYGVTGTDSGDALSLLGAASSPHEIQCRNDLVQKAIAVSLYKSGKLWQQSASIPPGQTAVFAFVPTLVVGMVFGMEEGEVMDSTIVSSVDTELSLLGIASADIVMTGGGPGAGSTAFRFTLENVVMA